MFSEHSKEYSLAQLAISNEFMLLLLSHRRITRLSKQIAIVSAVKILAAIPLSGHFPYLNCSSRPHFSLIYKMWICVVGMFLNLSFVYPLWVHCYEFSCICTFFSSLLYFHIHVKRLSTEKDCVIFLWRQKVAWALFYIKMADIYIEIGSDFWGFLFIGCLNNF